MYHFKFIDNFSSSALHQNAVVDKISALSKLPAGRDMGEGEIISKKCIEYAVYIYKNYGYGLECEAMPMTSGGVKLVLTAPYEVIMDVSINPDLIIDFVVEKGYGSEFIVLMERENVSTTALSE